MKLHRGDSLERRFWSRVQKGADCWLWTGAGDSRGYGFIRKDTRQYRAHQMSWMIHHGDIPKGIYVLHSCDNPPCVNPDHLFLGTHADNMNDKTRKGRAAMVLAPEQVQEIRRIGRTLRQKDIAERFHVDESLISRILKGEIWQHLS